MKDEEIKVELDSIKEEIKELKKQAGENQPVLNKKLFKRIVEGWYGQQS